MNETDALVVLASIMIAHYLLYCLYLKSLHGLLKVIKPGNRQIEPGQVWLLLLWIISLVLDFLSFEQFKYLHSDSSYIFCTTVHVALNLFLMIWQYRIVAAIARSIRKEYQSHNVFIGNRPTFSLGLFMVISGVVSIGAVLPYRYSLNDVGQVGSIAWFVLWIIYWIQTYRYKKKIQAMQKYSGQQDSPIFSNLY